MTLGPESLALEAATEPIRVQRVCGMGSCGCGVLRGSGMQRRASATGAIMACGQKIALGRIHAGQTLTIAVPDIMLAVELDDQETRVVRRSTTKPVGNIKTDRPWTVPLVS